MAGYETILVADHGPARLILVNRPDVLNAINAQVLDDLTRAFEEAGTAAGVRGVVLSGAGEKAFVAGADIAQMSDMDPERALAFSGKGHALGEIISALPVPVIAAVNGFALGGGCELALACDFIYAAEHARFGQPEVKLGVIPGFGGTQRLSRRIGAARALELVLTGDMIATEEALRLGLVNRVVPRAELVATAVATVEKIAQMGPRAIAAAKRVVHEGASMPLDDANDLEQRAFAELFATFDQKEGMAAFLAKRPAKFENR